MTAPRFDLPAADYPFTIKAHRKSDGLEVWRCIIREPGPVVIPALAKIWGEPIGVRFEYPDGRVEEIAAP